MSVRSAGRGRAAARSIRLELRSLSIVATSSASLPRWGFRCRGSRGPSSASIQTPSRSTPLIPILAQPITGRGQHARSTPSTKVMDGKRGRYRHIDGRSRTQKDVRSPAEQLWRYAASDLPGDRGGHAVGVNCVGSTTCIVTSRNTPPLGAGILYCRDGRLQVAHDYAAFPVVPRGAAAAGAAACPPSPLAGVTAPAGMTVAPACSILLVTDAISS